MRKFVVVFCMLAGAMFAAHAQETGTPDNGEKERLTGDECYLAGRAGDAVQWWKLSAGKGNANAQFNVGCCYQDAIGVERNYDEAFRWFMLSAKQGYADAQLGLGTCYSYGRGVEKDYAKALYWWRLAAEKGQMTAINNIAVVYNVGGKYGVKRDRAEALKWYRRAAELGDRYGRHNLGVLYYRGKNGLKRDYDEAVRLFGLSAGQDCYDGQRSLGTCYAKGRGVARDYRVAAYWYSESAEQATLQGDEKAAQRAQKYLRQIAGRVKKAQMRAKLSKKQ